MIPNSQKYLPISFLLMDPGGMIAEMDLIIRPEELSRQTPSRLNVTQTLGGAFADSFGPGIGQIMLSGNTGWRGTDTEDGAALFIRLKNTVFSEWHKKRQERESRQLNPDCVQLVLADQLNGYAVVVAPENFRLQRHRTKPLLSQYNIVLKELGNFSDQQAFALADSIVEAIDNPVRETAALESLRQNMATRSGLLSEVQGISLPAGISAAATAAMETTNALLEKVDSISETIVDGIDAAAGPVLAVSSALSSASKNAFSILATESNVGAHAKHILMRISGNFLDAYCNLRNGFNRLKSFQDFSELFGASACSSTGGGRPHSPWAQENPFLKVFPSEVSQVSVSDTSMASMSKLSALDWINNPIDQSDVTHNVMTAVEGISV